MFRLYCRHCGRIFEAQRSTAQYCTDYCRLAQYRLDRRLEAAQLLIKSQEADQAWSGWKAENQPMLGVLRDYDPDIEARMLSIMTLNGRRAADSALYTAWEMIRHVYHRLKQK